MPRPNGSFLTKEQRTLRFLLKTVKRDSGCVDWIGTKFHNGYGVCVWKRKHMKAHRVSWELFVGQIPDGKQVLHKCDRPCCVNPQHLFIGDPKSNNDDMRRKGRNRVERGVDRYNAKLDDDSVRQIRILHESGSSIGVLADAFCVNAWTITNIVHRKRWKHVP